MDSNKIRGKKWLRRLVLFVATVAHRAQLDTPTLVPRQGHPQLPRRLAALRRVLWSQRITALSGAGQPSP
jgi:hypothetical protein